MTHSFVNCVLSTKSDSIKWKILKSDPYWISSVQDRMKVLVNAECDLLGMEIYFCCQKTDIKKYVSNHFKRWFFLNN